MKPAPPVTTMRCPSSARTSVPAHQRAQEERGVGRSLGHAAHEVSIPLHAEGHVDAHGLTVRARRCCSSGRMPYSIWYSCLNPRPPISPTRRRVASTSFGSWVAAMGSAPPATRVLRQRRNEARMSSGRCQARDDGSWYAPLHRRTREPGTPSAPAVILGAMQGCLEHRTGRREVLADHADDAKRRVGGGVVLHVDRDRRAGGSRRLADRARVVERHRLVERLAHRGELHRHLRAGGEALLGETPGERPVRVDGGPGRGDVECVLAEMIERHMQSVAGQCPGDAERVVDGLAGDESGGRRRGSPGAEVTIALDLAAPRRPEEHMPERGRGSSRRRS